MSHPRNYPAIPDDAAPFGWKSDEGMFYRPDFGDKLIEIDGVKHIQVNQLVSYAEPGDRPHIPPMSSALI